MNGCDLVKICPPYPDGCNQGACNRRAFRQGAFEGVFNQKVRTPGRPGATRKAAGFTTLELLAVLVIMGIIAVVVAFRFTDIGARDVAAANSLKMHLRYAQLRAMGDTVEWGIAISGNSYELLKDGETAPVLLPGENHASKEFERVSFSPPGVVSFSGGRGEPSGPETVSAGSKNIHIERLTGFIR